MQHYATLSALQEKHRLCLPGSRLWPWRLTQNAPVGQITGLPAFRGKAVATNGILVAIETSGGQLLIGHIQWFETDNDEPLEEKDVAVTRPKLTNDEINQLLE